MKIEDANNVKVGDIVCDCRELHLKVISVDGDDLILEDGSSASARHCCDTVPHEWEHMTEEEKQRIIKESPSIVLTSNCEKKNA